MLITLERAVLRVRSLLLCSCSTTTRNVIFTSEYHDNYGHELINQSLNRTENEDCLKSLRIAILGLPNVGKSTVINRLIRRPLCAASSKVQTTQAKSDVMLTEENTQLIFIDTPGIVTAKDVQKYELEPTFVTHVERSIETADCVGLVQDASHYKADMINKRVRVILDRLQPNTTMILILNKIDIMKKKADLLEIATELKGRKHGCLFRDIFMISALNNSGVDDLRNYLFNMAKPKNWDYKHRDLCSDLPQVLVERAVRSKFMDELPNEIPYKLKILLEHFTVLPDDSVNTVVSVDCPSDRISSLVMGIKGQRLRKVALEAEQELCNAFRTAVRLKIVIKFEKELDRDVQQKRHAIKLTRKLKKMKVDIS